MDVGHLAPELRERLVRKLDAPSAPQLPLADLRALVARHARDPAVDQNQGTMTVTHLYVWLGDFDSAGKSDDSVTTTIVAWDRYPAGWRNSPGMKLKLRKQGVVDYWRAHGFPPQCHPSATTTSTATDAWDCSPNCAAATSSAWPAVPGRRVAAGAGGRTVLPWFNVSPCDAASAGAAAGARFVPALVFAWVFELTPEGIKRDADVKPENRSRRRRRGAWTG
jgi:hypothetical protein